MPVMLYANKNELRNSQKDRLYPYTIKMETYPDIADTLTPEELRKENEMLKSLVLTLTDQVEKLTVQCAESEKTNTTYERTLYAILVRLDKNKKSN